jgi:hypothetical protein
VNVDPAVRWLAEPQNRARLIWWGIAAGSFVLSFDHIREVAERELATPEEQSWIYPLIVDGIVVGATEMAWSRAKTATGGLKDMWLLIAVPVAATALYVSISFLTNAAAYLSDNPLVMAFAGLPAISQLLALFLGASEDRRLATATAARTARRAPQDGTAGDRPNLRRTSSKQNRRFTPQERADALARVEAGETQTAVAADLGCTPQAIRWWKQQAEQRTAA